MKKLDHLNTVTDFQKFINDNNIQSIKEFSLKFGGVYNRAKRLGVQKKLVFPKMNVHFYDHLNTAEDFNSFIKSNNISSPKNMKERFPGALERIYTLHLTDKIIYPNKRREYNTIEQFITLGNELFDNKYDYSKVTEEDLKNGIVTIKCKIHNIEAQQSVRTHMLGRNPCSECSMEKYKNSKKERFGKKFMNSLSENYKESDKFDFSQTEYINRNTPVEVGCKLDITHGTFLASVDSILKGSLSCPRCNASKLEASVMNILDQMKISYIYQYRSDYLGKQSVDIFVENLNLAIEAQGRQHFHSIERFNKDKGFKLTVARDTKKLKILKEQNINVYYFIDKTIDRSLSSISKEYLQPNGYMGQTLIQSIKELYSKIKSLCISREIPFTQIKKFEEVQYRPLNFRTI